MCEAHGVATLAMLPDPFMERGATPRQGGGVLFRGAPLASQKK